MNNTDKRICSERLPPDALRAAELERLFWRAQPPTEAEKRALGLDDVLWPEQLKQAHYR